MELEVSFPIMQAFRNTHEYLKGWIVQVPEFGAVCKEHAVERLAWLDRELDGRKFVAGDRFTIADITLLIGVDFGRVSDIRIGPEHKSLARWYGEVSSRPSAQA
jgi:glutathione S-transferase